MNPLLLEEIVKQALNEDIGYGDLTTESIVSPGTVAEGRIIAKAPGRIAGMPVAAMVFRLLDPSVMLRMAVQDGADVDPGDEVASLLGPAGAVLMGERVALNFLQHLSGIATATAAAVRAAAPYGAHVVDTRKTTPGLRMLEKYAVRVGGGMNHRIGLDDAVLIKENHLAVAGGIRPAVERVRRRVGHMVKIEVEVETLAQVTEALEVGVDAILLDNMSIPDMQEAVRMVGGRVVVEASGNVSLDNVAAIAATGVNIISMGRLTHSSPALDLSLRVHMRR